MSDASDPICFYNDMILNIGDTAYSRAIAKGTRFPSPLTLRVSRPDESYGEKNGVLMFVAAPQMIKDQTVYYPTRERDIFFQYSACIYVKQKYTKAK